MFFFWELWFLAFLVSVHPLRYAIPGSRYGNTPYPGVKPSEVHRKVLTFLLHGATGDPLLPQRNMGYRKRLYWFIRCFAGQVRNGLRPSLPSDCPRDLYQVLLGCLHSDYDTRPTFAGLEAEFQTFLRGQFYICHFLCVHRLSRLLYHDSPSTVFGYSTFISGPITNLKFPTSICRDDLCWGTVVACSQSFMWWNLLSVNL